LKRDLMKPMLIVLLALVAVPSLARDRGQYAGSPPELRAWFESLSSGKGPCCSVADGRTIADADWISNRGHYRVRVPRRNDDNSELVWVDVPDDAVITEPNRAGRTIVWPLWVVGYGVSIRCFMPGAMT
jgi:hypothetical protein